MLSIAASFSRDAGLDPNYLAHDNGCASAPQCQIVVGYRSDDNRVFSQSTVALVASIY